MTNTLLTTSKQVALSALVLLVMVQVLLPTQMASAQGANIIKNAGFENDTAHWELGNSGKYTRMRGGSTSQYSVRGVNVKYANFHQRSSQHVKPNTQYNYVFNYKIERNPDHQPIHFIIARGSDAWNGPYLVESKVGSKFGASNAKWQSAQGTFNTKDNTSIALRVTSPSGSQTFYVDNFQVFESNGNTTITNNTKKPTIHNPIISGAFNADLYKGVRNNDVKRLQTMLDMPTKYRTGYYGPLTKKAVASYQKQNKIYPAVGYFGPKTRKFVNKNAISDTNMANTFASTKATYKKATRKTIKTIYAKDAHQARACKEHQEFKDWLGNERGAVGEFGVSYKDNPGKHRDLVDMFYTIADTYNYDTYAWATGEWWGNEYKVLPFSWDTASSKLIANDITIAFKNRTSANNHIRGINLAGAEFAIHNNGGVVGVNERGTKYLYHSKSKIWSELKKQGITHVRYPIRLERLFYNDGKVRDGDWQEIKMAMELAHKAGIKVLIEPHNFGRMKMDGKFYTLGDGGRFSASLYYKMMGKLAEIAKGNEAIFAIGLMNEPEALNKDAWEKYSQGAVTAMRNTGFNGTIYIPTWNWQGIQDVTRHSKPWVKDAGKHVYEVHQYFDANHSGAYNGTYDHDEAALRQQGYKAGNCAL